MRGKKRKDRFSGTGPYRSGWFRDRRSVLHACRPRSSGSVSRLMFQVLTGNTTLPQGSRTRRVGSSRGESRVGIVKLQTRGLSLIRKVRPPGHRLTHLDLVIKDITAGVIDHLALIQQGCAVLGTSSRSQKVGRWGLEASVLAIRCGSHIRHHRIGDRVGRSRSRISCSGGSVDVTVGESVAKVNVSAMAFCWVHLDLATHAFFRAQIHLFRL